MRPILLTDIDDTVLCYSDAFQLWREAEGHRSHRRLKDKFDITSTFGIDADETDRLVRRFSRTAAYAALRAEPDAKVVLADFARRGWRFVAVTAAHEDLAEVRKANLEAEFDCAWEVHCVGHRGSKVGVLRSFAPTTWVDDLAANAVHGAEAGHSAFLVDREHNRSCGHAGVCRVPDWFAVREAIDGKACNVEPS